MRSPKLLLQRKRSFSGGAFAGEPRRRPDALRDYFRPRIPQGGGRAVGHLVCQRAAAAQFEVIKMRADCQSIHEQLS